MLSYCSPLVFDRTNTNVVFYYLAQKISSSALLRDFDVLKKEHENTDSSKYNDEKTCKELLCEVPGF